MSSVLEEAPLTVAVEVLGPVRVRGDDEVSLERPAHRRLLSILALAGGDRVSTEALIDRFWDGQPPASAKAALQTHISTLRKLIGSSTLVTEGYGYRLAVDDGNLDVNRFESLATTVRTRARESDWEGAANASKD